MIILVNVDAGKMKNMEVFAVFIGRFQILHNDRAVGAVRIINN
jgi:hypothetical protein